MTTPTASTTDSYDPTRYEWYQDPNDPYAYFRRALGPESKWAHQAPETRQLFLTGQITLTNEPISKAQFIKAAGKAWRRMRYEYPEIVQISSKSFNADGSAIMRCEIPKDESFVGEWIDRTLYSNTRTMGEEDAMVVVEREMREQEIKDPVSLRLHSAKSPREAAGSGVRGAVFCMSVDHGLADGIGAWLLIGKVFKTFGEEIGGREEERLDWAKAVEKIPKAWVQMLNAEQRTEGKGFEEGVQATTDLVMQSTKSLWGINFQPSELYTPSSITHNFSPSQSKEILNSIQLHLGPTYSITHLGHASMILALLKAKPPQSRHSHQTHLISPLFANGRRYLDPEHPKSTDHIPMCRAISGIEFLDVDRYIRTDEDEKQTIRRKLAIACEEARRSYQRIREQRSLLTESFAVAEVMATAKNDVKAMADPFFISDGIAERYTPRSYFDEGGEREIFALPPTLMGLRLSFG